jgi:hypothetical protein
MEINQKLLFFLSLRSFVHSVYLWAGDDELLTQNMQHCVFCLVSCFCFLSFDTALMLLLLPLKVLPKWLYQISGK